MGPDSYSTLVLGHSVLVAFGEPCQSAAGAPFNLSANSIYGLLLHGDVQRQAAQRASRSALDPANGDIRYAPGMSLQLICAGDTLISSCLSLFSFMRP